MKKHKHTKIFILMIAVLLVLMPSVSFGAWNQGSSGSAAFTKILVGTDGRAYYINENVKTVFYDSKGNKSIKNGNGRSKVRWRYLKITDTKEKTSQYGFCVEFGAKFSNSAQYKAQNGEQDHILFQKLPPSARKIITAALCYGRNGMNKTPLAGINDADYYFATQVLIWEAQQGLRTVVTDSKGIIKGTKLKSAHGMSSKHMYYFLKGRSAEKCYVWLVKKINDHLKTYSFSAEAASKATVYSLKYDEKTKLWTKTITDTNKKAVLPISSSKDISISKKGYQYTIKSKKPITKTAAITLRNKMDKGSSTGKLLLWNCVTNKDNQAIIMGAKDLSAMYIKVKTSAVPTDVEIKKVDGETGAVIGLANTTYDIQDAASGKYIHKGIMTDDKGIARVPEKLPPGKYLLKETLAPDGYCLQKEGQSFQVIDGKKITITQKDKPQKSKIIIEKLGEMLQVEDNAPAINEKPLSDISFEIIAAEDIITNDGTVRLKKGDVADRIITDSNGKANSKELYLGKYNIVEKETPERYEKLLEPVRVELLYEGQDVQVGNKKVLIKNRLKTGTVEIEKTDVSTGEPLPDTGIEILDENKEKLVEGRTDDKGILKFQMLPIGKYYFREFDAPVGYQLDESLFPFEIKENNEIVKCEMSNHLISGSSKEEKPTEEKPREEKPNEIKPTEQMNEKKSTPDHRTPQTGDSSPFIVIMLAGFALSILIIVGRKFNRY